MSQSEELSHLAHSILDGILDFFSKINRDVLDKAALLKVDDLLREARALKAKWESEDREVAK